MSLNQIMSLIGIILNGLALYFVSYGTVHHRGKRGFTISGLEGKSDSPEEKHKDKVARYVLFGILLIIFGNILQSIGVIYSGRWG